MGILRQLHSVFLLHVTARVTQVGLSVISAHITKQIRKNHGGKFLKTLWCCVGGGVSTIFRKRGYPVSVVQASHHRVQQISWQSALQTAQKEYTDRIPFTLAFHPTTKQLNPSLLKTLNYFKMIQRLVLSFGNLYSFHSNVTNFGQKFTTN